MYERDGTSLEMPMDPPVLGPNLLQSGSDALNLHFDYLALVRHAEKSRNGASASAFTQIAVGGFHMVRPILQFYILQLDFHPRFLRSHSMVEIL